MDEGDSREEEIIQRFSLPLAEEDLDEIRAIIAGQAALGVSGPAGRHRVVAATSRSQAARCRNHPPGKAAGAGRT